MAAVYLCGDTLCGDETVEGVVIGVLFCLATDFEQPDRRRKSSIKSGNTRCFKVFNVMYLGVKLVLIIIRRRVKL